ncbi:MAG: hypothetical protein MUF61_01585 [archaeon]|jgi:hypothetical protein|nr:hypothetical protein [archaeon]
MKDRILIKENTGLDKLVDTIIGSLVTLSSVAVGGVSLWMIGDGHYEYLPHLALTTPLIFTAGQQFYTPAYQKNR